MDRLVKLIAESSAGRVVEVDAPEGAALFVLCDAPNAPIPFSCRTASCGTCRVHVIEGADDMVPPEDDELDVLDVFNHQPPHVRLACQARLRPGAALVHVKAIQEE